MGSAPVKSGVSADALTVNSDRARLICVNTSGSKLDSAGFTGLPVIACTSEEAILVAVDRLGTPITGTEETLLWEELRGSKIVERWSTEDQSFTANYTQANTTFNNNFDKGTGNGHSLISLKSFAVEPGYALRMRFRTRPVVAMNQDWSIGFASSRGVSFRHLSFGCVWLNNDGCVAPCISTNADSSLLNGNYILGKDILGSVKSSSAWVTFEIMLSRYLAVFTAVEDGTGVVLSREAIRVPIDLQRIIKVRLSISQLGILNTPSIGSSDGDLCLLLGQITVSRLGFRGSSVWGTRGARNGISTLFSPTAISTQTANYANSAAPNPGTLSNTAASYTTLGGQFSYQVVASAETDYCLFGFTVPSPYTLVVTGIHISMYLSTAVSSTTTRVRQFGVGANGATANLSTGGFLRKALGSMTLPAASQVGTQFTKDIDVEFPEPLITYPGRVFAVIIKCPAGAADGTSLDRGVVDVRGYFE